MTSFFSQSLADSDIDKMIADDLVPAQKSDIQRIYEFSRDIFGFHDHPLGQTSVITHKINTGDAGAIRRLYRGSNAEKQIMERWVDKRLMKDLI